MRVEWFRGGVRFHLGTGWKARVLWVVLAVATVAAVLVVGVAGALVLERI